MGYFFTAFIKVFVMVIMMAVGWIAAKTGTLTEEGSKDLTKILLNIVTPCLIVDSFLSISPGAISVGSMLQAVIISFMAIGIAILISMMLFRREVESRKTVLRFEVIFSNAGFMGLPLVQSIVGDGGAVFASFFVAVFNFLCWTYGYSLMNHGKKIKIWRLICNPGTIGIAIGLPLYLLNISLPSVLQVPLQGFSDLNTPLAMLVVGGYIAKMRVKDFLSDKNVFLAVTARLLLAPMAFVGVLCLIRPEYDLFLSTVIQASAPSAANGALFAAMYGQDAKLASKTVAMATLFSVVTIPIITSLVQLLLTNIL